jgi:hypothetical protein
MIEATLESPLSGDSVNEVTGLYSQTIRRGINWIFAIAVVSFHLGALAALFYFRWPVLVAFAVVWILAQNVGIAMGYHRLFTLRTSSVWRLACQDNPRTVPSPRTASDTSVT